MTTARTNRRVAAVASALCLALIVTIAILSATPSRDAFGRRPSTFFTDPSGARAIYLVLQQVLPSVEQWRVPLTALAWRRPNSGRSTLIVMGAPGPLGHGEAAVLEAWLESGGQLIVATSAEWHLQRRRGAEAAKGFLAGHDIQVRKNLSGEAAIAGSLARSVGRGRIIYVPDGYAFSNDTLRTSDNAVWLAERCSEWGGPAWFDEYHQGFGEQRGLIPLVGLFATTPWGLVCLQLALAGAVYIVGCQRRFGRPLEELPVERTDPMETVQAIGGLFEASRARGLSARTIHQHLNAHLSAILGHRIDLANAQTRERLANPAGIGKADLDAYAQVVKDAVDGERASDADLLRIGREATAIARSFSHGVARSKRAAATG